MDNEKLNGSENGSGGITAEDLIRRLKSNIKKDPNYREGDLIDSDTSEPNDISFERNPDREPDYDPSAVRRHRIKLAFDSGNDDAAPSEEATGETKEAEPEETTGGLKEFFSGLEKAAETDEGQEAQEAPSPSPEEETVTAPTEEAAPEQPSGTSEEELPVSDAYPEDFSESGTERVSEKELNKFLKFASLSSTESAEEQIPAESEVPSETPEPAEQAPAYQESAPEQAGEETDAPDADTREINTVVSEGLKRYDSTEELSIENYQSDTNVYVRQDAKQKKGKELFEEEKEPPFNSAEQLSFTMDEEGEKTPVPSEEEIKKSIKEAEAFIYERERIDDPKDVISEDQPAPAEENASKEGYDQTDIWLASAFGDEKELKEQVGEEKAQEIENELENNAEEYLDPEKKELEFAYIDDEFTPESNTADIFNAYKKKNKLFILKLGALALMMLVTFLFENVGALSKSDIRTYPLIYVLMSLQLLLFVCAIGYKELYRGVKGLLLRTPVPESLTSVACAASLLFHIVFCFIIRFGSGYTTLIEKGHGLYVFPLTLCVFMTELFAYFNLRREVFSFNIISSKKMKFTVNRLEDADASLETEAFSEYLSGDDVSMFKIGKTSFVNGFRERINSYPRNNSYIRYFVIAAPALALIFTVISSVKIGFTGGLSFGMLVFALTVPACLLFGYAYPFYSAVKKAFGDNSTIIGDVSLDEYDGANTISFDDKDVFPSYSVKVKSIKVYGDNRIDKILYDAASVFKMVGGPLSDVFEMATLELGHSENVEILAIEDEGLEATVDGERVCIGKVGFMREHSFEPSYTQEDEGLENNGDACVMYLSLGNGIAAKMYIRYLVDPDFEYTLTELYRAGLCVGIKTFDPNINDKLLGQKIEVSRYPVKILRCRSLDDMNVATEEENSGIVSKSSSRSLLAAFSLCSKVLYTGRLSMIVKALSVVIGLLLASFLLLFGEIIAIPSIYVALYNIVFTLVIYGISRAYI